VNVGVVTPVNQQVSVTKNSLFDLLGSKCTTVSAASGRIPYHCPRCAGLLMVCFALMEKLNRMCGSSQQAIHFASQAIASGDMDCVIACGVEVWTIIFSACVNLIRNR